MKNLNPTEAGLSMKLLSSLHDVHFYSVNKMRITMWLTTI